MIPVSAQPIEIKGRSARCLRSFLSLKNAELDAGTNSGWAHVAMLGEWRGHSKGEFAFTQGAFEEIIRNFAAQSNPIPWDYEHDTFNPGTTGPKPASGWVKRLELRNNGTELWAYVDWTPRAADMIRSGEYRFCSPVVDFESLDRKSNDPIGAELLSVALTNNPFLDGQHPLALSWVAASFPPPDDKDKQPPPHPGQPQQQQPQSAEPKGPPGQPPHAPPFPPKNDDKAMGAPPQQPGQQPQHPNPNQPPQHDPGPPPPAASSDASADAALGDGAEADANAFLDALASASGLDKSQTLAALMDMTDQIVNALQKTVARDGTPAEATRTMTDKKIETPTAQPAATPAATTPEPTTVQASAPAGTLTLDELERQNDKAALERMKARLDALERERTEEKGAAIAALVDEKIAGGYILPDQRDNAIWAFTQDRKRAEQIYAHQMVPIGQRQSQASGAATNPAAAAAAGGGQAVDMSQFSSLELKTIECLQGAHKTREQACAIVLKNRSNTAVH